MSLSLEGGTRRSLSVLGLLLSILGVAFVIWSLVAEWSAIRSAATGAAPMWILSSLVVGLASLVGIATVWGMALKVVGIPVPVRTALRWFFVGELGKYVPGGVWAVVGRAEVSVRGGAGRTQAYSAVALSLLLTYLAGAIVALALLPSQGQALSGQLWPLWLVLFVAMGAVAVHPRVMRMGFALSGRLFRRSIPFEPPPWRTSLQMVILLLPCWIGIGLSVWMIATGLGAEVNLLEIIFAGVLAWVVGFLVVPAPSGLGVREGVFVLAVSSLSSGMAAAVAILARVVFVVADLVGAILAVIIDRSPAEQGGDGRMETIWRGGGECR